MPSRPGGRLHRPRRPRARRPAPHRGRGVRFRHRLLDVLLRDETLGRELVVVDLRDHERGTVWKDGRLAFLLGPGRHAMWNRTHELEVEVHAVTQPRLRHPRLEAILASEDAPQHLRLVHVDPNERVLLFREGRLLETLSEGPVALWKQSADVTWKAVDLREQVADVAGQEIMTADKVTLRVNLVVTWRVVDPERALTRVADHAQALYRQAQLALRAAVGERELDELLVDRATVGEGVRATVGEAVRELGLVVIGVGLRDVILPGDMKAILDQVIEARKRAEANLVRRREETAAARSQANTARLLAENPVLLRMKELEALQEILAGSNATFVLGPGELLGQVRDLARTVGDGG